MGTRRDEPGIRLPNMRRTVTGRQKVGNGAEPRGETSPAEVAEAIAPHLDFLRGGNEAFRRSQRVREREARKARTRWEANDNRAESSDGGRWRQS